MGIAWDFAAHRESFSYPAITGIFYSDKLKVEDWGKISGMTGRNTKVSGMRSSGKSKMGKGWVLIPNDPEYQGAFSRLLGVKMSN